MGGTREKYKRLSQPSIAVCAKQVSTSKGTETVRINSVFLNRQISPS